VTRTRPLSILITLAYAAISAACGTTPRAGHLIIAGGGTSPDNGLIYSRFIAPLPADAVIGIIPTASANPPESAASAAKTIARYAGSRRMAQFNISLQNRAAASDAAVAEQLRQCSALWFTGGVQSRITEVFRPPSGDTLAYQAACDVLARGGVIGGTSAGAAMMSDPMITGGSSGDALSGTTRGQDDDSGFGMAQGMGFFPFGLTDQHFLRRGRLGRLIVALERTKLHFGYGVDEGSAMHVDLTTGVVRALGPVLLVDASTLRREGTSITGVRVSLLNAGDTVDGPTGRVCTSDAGPLPAPPPDAPLPAAWSRDAVRIAIERLMTAAGQSLELRSESWILRLSKSKATAAWLQSGRLSAAAIDLQLYAGDAGNP
jgi:cyanophycinase